MPESKKVSFFDGSGEDETALVLLFDILGGN
jgi:hypothetical protein